MYYNFQCRGLIFLKKQKLFLSIMFSFILLWWDSFITCIFRLLLVYKNTLLSVCSSSCYLAKHLPLVLTAFLRFLRIFIYKVISSVNEIFYICLSNLPPALGFFLALLHWIDAQYTVCTSLRERIWSFTKYDITCRVVVFSYRCSLLN